MRITHRRINVRGFHPWWQWYYADKDGSPVLIDRAKWWKHVNGFVVARRHEVIFRHHDTRRPPF